MLLGSHMVGCRAASGIDSGPIQIYNDRIAYSKYVRRLQNNQAIKKVIQSYSFYKFLYIFKQYIHSYTYMFHN